MDRISIEVLKYINKKDGHVLAEQIAGEFGEKGMQSLSMLYHEGYLSRSLERTTTEPDAVTGKSEMELLTNVYRIEPLGRDFLEHRFGNAFDKWLGRANSIFTILGGALLSKPLWAILEWAWGKAILLWDWICEII